MSNIFRANGHYSTIRQINHNPGLIRRWSNYGERNGYTVFPSRERGWWAFRFKVSRDIRNGKRIKDLFEDAEECILFCVLLAERLKVDEIKPTTKLDTFLTYAHRNR